MKRNELTKRYARIRSLQQLRIEREKLSWIIESKEKTLQEDYDDFRTIFSWNYMANAAMEALGSASALVSGIVSGAQMLFSLFRNRSNEKKKRIRGK